MRANAICKAIEVTLAAAATLLTWYKTERINPGDRIVTNIAVRVDSAAQSDRICLDVFSGQRVIVSVDVLM